MNLTKNFTIEEFACNDKKRTPVPAKYWGNVQKLAMNLQALRDELGEPVRVQSGYRTAAHNRAIGGAPKSQHLTARAGDIRVASKTPQQVAAIIERLIRAGKMLDGGIGIYDNFVHYDIRSEHARW